jgi:hypothetical protein
VDGEKPRPGFQAVVDRYAEQARRAGAEVEVTWFGPGQARISCSNPGDPRNRLDTTGGIQGLLAGDEDQMGGDGQ